MRDEDYPRAVAFQTEGHVVGQGLGDLLHGNGIAAGRFGKRNVHDNAIRFIFFPQPIMAIPTLFLHITTFYQIPAQDIYIPGIYSPARTYTSSGCPMIYPVP